VIDVGALDGGAPFIVMEYLEGCDLAAMLHRAGRLPVRCVVDYLMQALQAIAEAHSLGIVTGPPIGRAPRGASPPRFHPRRRRRSNPLLRSHRRSRTAGSDQPWTSERRIPGDDLR
jgi:aminoglycoside phosphotransferase (APT) family kinase protein